MDANLAALLSFPPHPPPQHPLSDQQYNDGMRAVMSTLKKINLKSFSQPLSSGQHILEASTPDLLRCSWSGLVFAIHPRHYRHTQLFVLELN